MGITELDFINPANEDPSSIRVVSCSSMTQVKRVDRMIQILARLSDVTSYSIEWHHVGDGPLSQSLKDRANQVGLNVTWHGHLSQKELFALYRSTSFDFFLNTSDSEGVPVSIMESIHVGLPFIALDVGGISDLVGEGTGHLLPHEGSEKELAHLIANKISLLKSTDREIVQAFGRAHFSSQTNFSAFARKLRDSI